MKSIKMFGKSVPLLAIVMVSLLAIGASAYLADYLSNSVSSDVTVTSPMEVGVSLGKPSWSTTLCWRDDQQQMVLSFPEGIDGPGGDPIKDWAESDWTKTGTLVIPGILGGETLTLYTMSANLADAEITGHEEIIISHTNGLTGDDFVSITARFDSIYGDQGYGGTNEELSEWYAINPYNIELWPTTDTSTWGAGETDVAMWNITFKPAASGTYTFSYRVVPVT